MSIKQAYYQLKEMKKEIVLLSSLSRTFTHFFYCQMLFWLEFHLNSWRNMIPPRFCLPEWVMVVLDVLQPKFYKEFLLKFQNFQVDMQLALPIDCQSYLPRVIQRSLSNRYFWEKISFTSVVSIDDNWSSFSQGPLWGRTVVRLQLKNSFSLLYRSKKVTVRYARNPENSAKTIWILLWLRACLFLLIELDNRVDKKASGSSP